MNARRAAGRSKRWERLLLGLTIWAVSWLLRGFYATLRPVVVQHHFLCHVMARGQPFLVAFWHGRLLYALRLYHAYQSWPCTVLVSRSKDGEVISRIAKCFGVQPTRGSSSRGGARGLLEMMGRVQQGYIACFTPDGPRGPRYQVQPGIVTVAHKTGAPILPVTYSARWKKVLKSWDQFVVPMLFSRVVVVYGEPIVVPAHATPDMLEAKQREIEARLRHITDTADRYFQDGVP